MKLVLASGSPRRTEILRWLGLEHVVRAQGVDETRDPRDVPIRHAARLAERKARAALGQASADELILAADTVVHLDDTVFDKPLDRAQAVAHLKSLSGRVHQVTTGFYLASKTQPDQPAHTVTTQVRFRTLSPAEIQAYVATGEADDKAGAYGIQGRAGVFVAELNGSWTNVMGLPVEACLRILAAHGVHA